MAGTRSEKLNAEFQKNIYEVLTRKVKNPRLTEMFSVTAVETDRELATAKVYISVYSADEAKKQATFEAICESAGFVRQALSKSMHIRTMPQFIFLKDSSFDYSEKINRLLNEVKAEESKHTTKKNEEQNG